MRQLAWLDYYRGKWHLATSNPGDPIRKWGDKDTALSDLAGEGWMISGSFPIRIGRKERMEPAFCGYELRRTIH